MFANSSDLDSISLKIVMIGNSAVGKTSLIKKWSTDIFEPNHTPTISAFNTLYQMNIDGESIDVFLWDTAGQEQYAPLSPLYIRNASAVILTVSCTDSDSLESVPKWIEIVNNANVVTPPIVLAINKIDLEDKAFTINEVREQFPNNDVFKEIIEVSAKTGDNITELFEKTGKLGLNFIRSAKKYTKKFKKKTVQLEQSQQNDGYFQNGGCC